MAIDSSYRFKIGERFEADFNRNYIKKGDTVEIVGFSKDVVYQMYCKKVGYKRKIYCFCVELNQLQTT